MTYIEYARAQIKQSGGRMTKTKGLVIDIIAHIDKPLNAYGIASKIEASGNHIDVVTVYRILESLEKLKLIHRSANGFMPCSYYSCSNAEHCHHQFHCTACERVVEVHIKDAHFLKKIEQQCSNLLITSHDFRFSGLCGQCQ